MTATVADAPSAPPAVEAPLTLTEDAPRVLGWWDQLGLWGNLGVSLLGPVGAVYVLAPAGVRPLTFLAAAVAVVVGTVIGTLMVAGAAVPGAQTGAPSMVLLRGLFGARLSILPTLVNVVQLVGWSVFEIVVITQGAQQLAQQELHWHGYRWAYIVAAGVLTTLMAIRPLGAVRVLRRYALVAVAVATTYLFVELLRHPLVTANHGSWSGFWLAVDFGVAVAVSWAPLASDYTRHARSARSAFTAAFVGYSVTQIASYLLGLLALATVVRASDMSLQHSMFAAFIAVPVGWLAFGALVARELDQSFADSYSTVVSIQNILPRFDRRILAVAVGSVSTVLALVLTIGDYQNFLTLLGSVFVPLTAVFLVDYFSRGRREWNVSDVAPARWSMVLPWVVGFAVYQMVNPGGVQTWVHAWQHVDTWLHFTPQTWMSASLLSFGAAALLTFPFSVRRRRAGPGSAA
jgi:NCS1 family nucleobase:cation symporter-1